MPDPLAPATRCREALAAAFRALGLPAYGDLLPALTDDAVVSQLNPTTENLTYPCVVLSSGGLTESILDDTNTTDLIGYPVAVALLTQAGPYEHDLLPAVEYWRHKLIGVVRRQRLAGLPDLHHMTVEPLPVYPADQLIYQQLVSGFTARLFVRVLIQEPSP